MRKRTGFFFFVMMVIAFGACSLDRDKDDQDLLSRESTDSMAQGAFGPVKMPFGGRVDAVVWNQFSEDNRVYFFNADRYGYMSFTPGSNVSDKWRGPYPSFINQGWNSLRDAGFSYVDAFLLRPLSGSEPLNVNYAWVFSGKEFVFIQYVNGGKDTLFKGPINITHGWNSLRDARFDYINAAFGTEHSAYFFKDDKYIKVSLSEDKLLWGPAYIVDEWPALKKAGFTHVDAILPISGKNPDSDGVYTVYVFSCDKYIRMKFIPGQMVDELQQGPRKITDGWPLLY